MPLPLASPVCMALLNVARIISQLRKFELMKPRFHKDIFYMSAVHRTTNNQYLPLLPSLLPRLQQPSFRADLLKDPSQE